MEEKTTDKEKIEFLVAFMDELTTKQLDLKRQLKLVEDEIKKTEYEMQTILEKEKKEIITCGYWSFGWNVKQRTAFDQSLFKEKHPELYEQFKTTKEIRSFCFGHKEG